MNRIPASSSSSCASQGCGRRARLAIDLGRPGESLINLCGHHFLMLADWVNALPHCPGDPIVTDRVWSPAR
jgi:hypothetical protein